MYEYNATVEKVVDGDTVDLLVDLGFSILYRHSCRLVGVNAPEHDTPEGEAAKLYLVQLLPPGAKLVLRTQKDKFEKYGRILGVLELPSKAIVNDLLVSTGHAKKWDGKGARPV